MIPGLTCYVYYSEQSKPTDSARSLSFSLGDMLQIVHNDNLTCEHFLALCISHRSLDWSLLLLTKHNIIINATLFS